MGSGCTVKTNGTVTFLMPDHASARYEEHDFPGFKGEMAKLCRDCTVIYQNANADASLQQQQFNAAMIQGATVIVLNPVDSSSAAALVTLAKSQDVKVVAYDRPIPGTPPDYYVSFDNEGLGHAIAKSLVGHMKSSGVPEPRGDEQLVGLEGPPSKDLVDLDAVVGHSSTVAVHSD